MSKMDITKEEYEQFVKTVGDLEKAKSLMYSSGTVVHPFTTTSTTGLPKLGTGLLASALGPVGLNKDFVIARIVQDGYWIKATGSRVTKDGWTTKSDWDYVVFDPDRKLFNEYVNNGQWHLGGSGSGEEFASLKHHNINLILVDKEDYWKKYVIATNLIKTLNSKTKDERIAVFDSVFGRDKNAQAVDFEECPF